MNAPVGDQSFKRDLGDLATNRIEAREDDSLRRVIDNQIDPSRLFERTDVAAFAPDNATLHVIAWQRHDGDRGIADEFAGNALNR